jgi:hypothetical protein
MIVVQQTLKFISLYRKRECNDKHYLQHLGNEASAFHDSQFTVIEIKGVCKWQIYCMAYIGSGQETVGLIIHWIFSGSLAIVCLSIIKHPTMETYGLLEVYC